MADSGSTSPSTPTRGAGHHRTREIGFLPTSQGGPASGPTDAEVSPEERRPAAYLHNLTASKIHVRGDGRSVVLAPLRRLPISDGQLRAFNLRLLRDSDLVRLERPAPSTVRAPIAVYGVLTVLAATAAVAGGIRGNPSAGLVAAGVIALLGVLLWSGWTLAGVVAGRPPTALDVSRWLGEKASQLLVFVIGFGSALAAALVANGALADGRFIADEGNVFRVALQTTFLGLAITFPAFLYYAFDRQRAAALRTRFIADVFRLDHRYTTVGDIEAKYGGRMKDVFGDAGSRLPSEQRVRAGRRRSPVVIATLVLSLALVVAFVDVAGQAPDGPLLALFTPTSAILPFAFLGAYLFAVLTALRSYLRGDLLPKAYSQIASRMLVVVTLSAVIGALSQELAPAGEGYSPWLLALAFLAGLVPNTVLQFVSEGVRRFFPLGREASLREPQSLTHLDGIDLYDRARLEQEGVTTLGGLVHGDLIDLMVQTRIPTGRLVDWVDQAVLLEHVRHPEHDPDGPGGADARSRWRTALRAEGLRTASDLVQAPAVPTELSALRVRVTAEPVMRRVTSWRRNTPAADLVIDARTQPGRAGTADAPASGAERPEPAAERPDDRLAPSSRQPVDPSAEPVLPQQRTADGRAATHLPPQGQPAEPGPARTGAARRG